MTELHEAINQLKELTIEKSELSPKIISAIADAAYNLAEINDTKPWGAYYRIANDEADRFIAEFFPSLDPVQARLGNAKAPLSPKILLVAPNQRLSWQYHNRRAERWAFLSDGFYHKSTTDEPGQPVAAQVGDEVQFAKTERHRLVGASDGYTYVAEIWQHTDPANLSNEADIVRLADDYNR